MGIRRIETARFDADGAGDAQGSVFGLPYGEAESSVVMVPVPWEPTTSYGAGAAKGPEAIREASRQLDLYDPELAEIGLARPWVFGLHMTAADPQIAAWNEQACRAARGQPRDVALVDALSWKMVERVEARVGAVLDAGKIAGVVGGDHSVAYGSIAAASRRGAIGVLHVDAHADLRVDYEWYAHSHASVMHGVLRDLPGVAKLVQIGIRDLSAAEAQRIRDDPRVHTVFDHALRGVDFEVCCERLVEQLPPRVWVSFDIDGLDPALCPGTGTPVPGGLGFRQAMSLLSRAARSGREIVGFDLVEVAPSPFHGQWDGNVGARILHRLCGAALLSRGARDSLRF
jgi:agmatinase